MSIDIEHDFQPEYVPIEGKDKIIKGNPQPEIRKSDFVYLATDPDREGEAISGTSRSCSSSRTKSRRVTFNEITKAGRSASVSRTRAILISIW